MISLVRRVDTGEREDRQPALPRAGVTVFGYFGRRGMNALVRAA